MNTRQEFDARRFSAENRIHVEDGALFFDQFVQVHPGELAPEREQALIAKLDKIYSQDAPSFYSSYPRGPVAQMLATLVPISAGAQKEALKDQLDSVKFFEKHGFEEGYQEEWRSRRDPFKYLVEGDATKPTIPNAAKEFLGNGLQLYLVLDEALSNRGYPKEIIHYLKRAGSMESLLSDLEDKLGVSAHRIMDIAHTQGVEGLGKALGLSDVFLSDIQQLSAIAAEAHFSDNIIQHWQIGRRIPQLNEASVEQHIEAGRLPRIAYTVQSMREQVGYNYDVPEGIREKELKVANALNRLPEPMREALYYLGAEFAYTPEVTVAGISGGVPAYGYHLKLVKEPGDVDGIYQVFLAQKESQKAFSRLVAHEVHHLFFPQRFNEAEVVQVDALAQKHFARIAGLKALMDAWEQIPEARDDIEWKINKDYAVGGMRLQDALGGKTMQQFRDLVEDAYQNTNIHSNFFSKTSYDTAPEKFYEIISRYAELRCVELEDNPALLNFIAPELSQIYDNHYMPHIEQQLAELKAHGPVKRHIPMVEGGIQGPVQIAAMLDATKSAPATHIHADSVQLEAPAHVHAPNGVESLIESGHSHAQKQAFVDRVTDTTTDPGLNLRH